MSRICAFLLLACWSTVTLGQSSPAPYKEQKHFTSRNKALSAAVFLGDSLVATSSLLPDDKGAIQIWNIATGNCTANLLGHSGGIFSLAVSSDNKILASGGDGFVVLHDPVSGKSGSRVPFESGRVLALTFAPRSHILFAARDDGLLSIVDADGAKVLHSIPAHHEAITSLAVSPDEKTVCSASYDGAIKLWDISTRKLKEKLVGNGGRVHGVAFSADGKFLAAACAASTEGDSKRAEVALWNLENTKQRKSLHDGTAAFTGVQFSKDSSVVTASRADGWITTWTTDGSTQAHLQAHHNWITSLHVSPDGKNLITTSWEPEAKLWDLPRWKPPALVPGELGNASALVYEPKSNLLLLGGPDKIVRILDPSGKRPARQLQSKADATLALAVSSDGKYLASSSGPHEGHAQAARFNRFGMPQAPAPPKDEPIMLWEIDSGKELRTFTALSRSILALAFSPNCQLLAAGSADKTVRIWNVAQGTEQMQLIGHSGPVTGLAFHPDGKRLASVSEDGTVRLWNLQTGLEKRSFHVEIGVSGLAYSPDGRWLAVGSTYDRRICVALWDAETGENRWLIAYPGFQCTGVTFSPDGRSIFASGGFNWESGLVSIIDTASGKPRIDLLAGKSRLTASCLSADGGSLFACGQSAPDKTELFHWNLPKLDVP